jgi:hypothetical protein
MSAPENQLDEAILIEIAVRFVLAMKRSIPKDSISPEYLWPRISSALETAASMAESWHQMVSKMAQKLGATSPHTATSSELSSLYGEIGENWESWRYLCERDTFYIVAIAQAENQKKFEAHKGGARKQTARKSEHDIYFGDL